MKTWTVQFPDLDPATVEADLSQILACGALTFFDAGEGGALMLLRAYAPSAWSSVVYEGDVGGGGGG